MLQHSTALDSVFHALSDASRRTIVEQLTRGPMSASELAKPLTMSLSAVVQHVRVLEASGLVRSEKRGRERICEIDETVLAGAEHWIAKRRSSIEHRLDRLAGYLGEADDERPKRRKR